MLTVRYSTKRVGYEVFDVVSLRSSSQLFATEAEAQRVCDRCNPEPVQMVNKPSHVFGS